LFLYFLHSLFAKISALSAMVLSISCIIEVHLFFTRKVSAVLAYP
jgi:hypothetical protein